MADRHDSERLRGFGNGQKDRRTFEILESLLRLKNYYVWVTQFAVYLTENNAACKLLSTKRNAQQIIKLLENEENVAYVDI